jgi:hypothetical protein
MQLSNLNTTKMRQIEINPKEAFAELQAMQQRERSRLMSEALSGHTLTPVQKRQLQMELEASTRFEGGEMLPIDEYGQVLRDPHGHEISIVDFIKATAKTLLGVEPDAPPQVKAPASGEELFHAMRGAKSDAERQQIYKAYQNK